MGDKNSSIVEGLRRMSALVMYNFTESNDIVVLLIVVSHEKFGCN